MTDDTIKVALLGAGYIGDYHLEALKHVPQARLIGVCDLSQTRADRLAACWKGEGQVPSYTDLARLIEEQRPDAVHVLTPAHAHFGPTKQLLEAGVAVFAEKPLAVTSQECRTLVELAKQRGVALGVGHNFLFWPAYERLLADLDQGRFGRVDQVDIVWNKPLPQVHGGPFGGWLFRDPRNVLFEVGPHSFAHAVHLVGPLEGVSADASDPVRLPNGLVFYRAWDVRGHRGRTAVNLRFSFGDSYPEHYLHLRGASASATVDFDLNTYVLREHARDLLNFDQWNAAARGARDAFLQASTTLGSFVLAKAGLPIEGAPYSASIARAARTFYQDLRGTLDRRLSGQLAIETVELIEQASKSPSYRGEETLAPAATEHAAVTRSGDLKAPSSNGQSGNGQGGNGQAAGKPTVLVLGGTGFMGRSLVERLREDGFAVRALVRDFGGYAEHLASVGAELVRGDFTDTSTVAKALDGIEHVFHLARGYCKSWDDYLRIDLEPTRRIAELCASRGAMLHYTSSIAIYSGGRDGEVIDENTPARAAAVRVNRYSRVKAEIEKVLLPMQQSHGLRVVILRPGIVIGRGGNPFHGGIGTWPYNSICRIWGDGTVPLPFVLVDDCADGMVRVLRASAVSGESFNLVGDAPLTGEEYLDELERIAGIKVRRLPVSPLRRFAEDVAKYGLKTVARVERDRPSYAYYKGLGARTSYTPEKAKRVLGWQPCSDRTRLVTEGIEVPAKEFLV